jgi:hypothetical protein
MCRIGRSPRSNETLVPAWVRHASRSAGRDVQIGGIRLHVPSSLTIRETEAALAREEARAEAYLQLSAPPFLSSLSPTPTMESRSKPFRGSNKPLPMSPPSEYDSVNSTGPMSGAMHHQFLPPREPSGFSPTTYHTSDYEAIRNLQQKYEAHAKLLEKQGHDMVRMERKLSDLSVWTQEQFRDLIERFSNMSHANSDMFAKQRQLSYDIAKSRLELKNEIKSEIHAMQTEINNLTASFSDLHAKINICLQRLWDNTEETFTEYQRRKNERLEEDLEKMKDQLDYLKQLVIRVRVGLTLAQPNHALSYTPVASEPPTTHGPAPVHAPSPSMGRETIHPAKHTLSKQISTPQFSTKRNASNLTSGILRSASGHAISFRTTKEALDTQDSPADNNRRWGLFGRRRRDASDTSSGKFPWSGRRQKEDDILNNIPPVPSIPMGISRIHNDSKSGDNCDPLINRRIAYPMDNVHPALRAQANERHRYHSPTTDPSAKTSPVEVQYPEGGSLPSISLSSPADARASDSPVEACDPGPPSLRSKEDLSKK